MREGGREVRRGELCNSTLPVMKDLPEGHVPSFKQNFSILLPHFQQHVKQLGHRKTVALRTGQKVVSEWRSREEIGCLVNTSSLQWGFFGSALYIYHISQLFSSHSSTFTFPHILLIFTISCPSNFYHTHVPKAK